MRFSLKKCRTCGVLGVGPNAVKLWPCDGQLYCERGTPKSPGCWRQALQWHESRGNIIMALQFELARPGKARKERPLDWRPYVERLCQEAGTALKKNDRKGFVQSIARALYALELKEIK